MPSGHEGDDELFARAWDERAAADRAARPPRRPQDPVLARDLDLAAALRDAGRSLPGPDDDARARMRAHLMSEIGGPARPGADARTRRTTRATPAREARPGARGPGSRRPADRRPAGRAAARGARRLLVNVITGACAVMLLGALTVLISRGALPGEMLYSVKRASESVELGLTRGQEEKGLKHLDFAAIRLEEVSDLVGRSATTAAGSGPVAAGLDPALGALVLENLRSFDEDARTGSRLILPIASRPAAPAPLDLGQWARAQSARLDTLSPSLPEDGRTAAASSQQMLERLSARATALDGERPCATGASEDDLGPLPTDGCTTGGSATPSAAPTEPSTTTSSTTSETTTTTSRTTPSTDQSAGTGSGGSAGGGTGGGAGSPLGPLGPVGTNAPAPVQVPMPVPLLPQVDSAAAAPGPPGHQPRLTRGRPGRGVCTASARSVATTTLSPDGHDGRPGGGTTA